MCNRAYVCAFLISLSIAQTLDTALNSYLTIVSLLYVIGILFVFNTIARRAHASMPSPFTFKFILSVLHLYMDLNIYFYTIYRYDLFMLC